MKVTIVNTHDIIGGAERNSYDLLHSLNAYNIKTKLLVGRKLGNDEDVHQIKYGRYDNFLYKIFRYNLGFTELFNFSPFKKLNSNYIKNSEILNIHNIHGKYWNLLSIPFYSYKLPIVITIHDEFLLTGDCAYSYNCMRWQKSCGRCPQSRWDKINRYPAVGPDSSMVNIFIKKLIFRVSLSKNIYLISPSLWLLNKIQLSNHLKSFKTKHIPYGIDLNFWKPINQINSRESLGIPQFAKVGLFIANNISEKRKGFDLVEQIYNNMPRNNKLLLLIVGEIEPEFPRNKYPHFRFLGKIHNNETLRTIYSATDFTLVLSKADNLPFVGIESLACGRPIVGTNIGGIPELIDNGKNGWIISDNDSINSGIDILNNLVNMSSNDLSCFQINCRKSAKLKYCRLNMSKEYHKLFTSIL